MCKIRGKQVHVDGKPDNVRSFVVMIRIGHHSKGNTKR